MRVAFVFALACLIAARASGSPEAVSPGERISQPGFSFVPPVSTWPWSVAMRSTYQITLLTAGPSPDESYAVDAHVFQLPSFKSNDEFLANFRRQLFSEPQTGRFEDIRTHLELYDQRKETCVRYTHAAKDFGAKRGGDFTIYETYGMNCIHPKNPHVGVRFELSRKAPPAVTNQEFDRLGESLLKSVQFSDFVAQRAPLATQQSEPPPTQQSEPNPTQQSTSKAVLEAAVSAGCGAAVSMQGSQLKPQLPFIDVTKLKESACACMTERVMTDNQIQQVLRLNDAEFRLRSNSFGFKQYFTGRLVSAALVCIGTQINEQTSNASLGF